MSWIATFRREALLHSFLSCPLTLLLGQALIALAMDPSADVRKLVCQGLVALMQTVPERLQPNLQAVVRYMLERNQVRHLLRRPASLSLTAAQDSDSGVALESCEFWSAFCEAELGPEFITVLQEFIPQLVPVLLTNMAYEADDEVRPASATAIQRPVCSADRPPRMCWRRRRRKKTQAALRAIRT
jgi:transportin-1